MWNSVNHGAYEFEVTSPTSSSIGRGPGGFLVKSRRTWQTTMGGLSSTIRDLKQEIDQLKAQAGDEEHTSAAREEMLISA